MQFQYTMMNGEKHPPNFIPKIKSNPMTDAERILSDNVRRDALNKLSLILTNYMDEMGMFKSCSNCEHWIEGPPDNRQQICGKWKMRPPTKVIVCGCDDHSDNIPF